MIEFFRHCPGCGRRFHIKLESKKVVGFERETRATAMVRRGKSLGARVLEGPPMIFNIEEFQYTYKCGHCGHEWTENQLEDMPIEADMDPIND